jgi:hypothetical protein
MVDQPKVAQSVQQAVAGYESYITAKIINTNDTITLNDYSIVITALAIRRDTGAALTTTISGNVVTVTTAGLTNVPVSFLIWGQR